MPHITTLRLVLREFALQDADFILELLNTHDWINNIGNRNINTIDDATNYIATSLISINSKATGMWAVVEKNTNVLMGMCGFVQRSYLDSLDIGFAFLPKYQGNGYAKEAAEACVVYGFEVVCLVKIYALLLPNNIRSVSLLKKLGFVVSNYITLGDEVLQLFQLTNMKTEGAIAPAHQPKL